MSGSAGGLLLVPLIFGVGPTLGIVMVTAALSAAASAVSGASNAYERQRRAERARIRQPREAARQERAPDAAAAERIGAFRDRVQKDMREETLRNAEASRRMAEELESGRRETRALLEDGDPEKYARYLGQIRSGRAELGKKIASLQEEVTRGYRAKAAESMEAVRREITRCQEASMGELQRLREAGEERDRKARTLAEAYLDEAKTLLASLEEDFQGAAFAGSKLASLRAQVGEADAQYGMGRYEASIAVAKDASVAALEGIYEADAEKQQWENYHKLALMLAAEVEAYLKNQEVVTAEAKNEMESRSGKTLENEIVGFRIGDYTDKTETGQSQFDALLAAAAARRRELESATPGTVSLAKMKEIAAELNEKIYPSAMTAVYKGILNMSNAFTRQNLSEEIVDFFEEHNFAFKGYAYDGDRHDGALRIGLENEFTGEEIVVTLAPELMRSGDVQTRVSIDQLRGDERNEERKEYYRQAVRDVVAKEYGGGASLSLTCDPSTRNRLSSSTELRDKLKR